MDVSFDLIKIFIYVAKYNSFSKTASYLHLTQSAVSQSVIRLENSLGVKLFNRNKGNLTLTIEGEALFKEASLGERNFNLGIMRALNLSSNQNVFKIKAPPILAKNFIYPKLDLIKRQYPELKIELIRNLHDYNTNDELNEGMIDLAVLKEKFELDKTLNRQKLTDLTYKLLYNPQYYDITQENCMEILKNSPITLKNRDINDFSIYNFLNKNNITPSIEVPHDEQVIDLITTTNYIGIAPIELDFTKSLKEIPLAPSVIDSAVYIATNNDNKLANKIAQLLLNS